MTTSDIMVIMEFHDRIADDSYWSPRRTNEALEMAVESATTSSGGGTSGGLEQLLMGGLDRPGLLLHDLLQSPSSSGPPPLYPTSTNESPAFSPPPSTKGLASNGVSPRQRPPATADGRERKHWETETEAGAEVAGAKEAAVDGGDDAGSVVPWSAEYPLASDLVGEPKWIHSSTTPGGSSSLVSSGKSGKERLDQHKEEQRAKVEERRKKRKKKEDEEAEEEIDDEQQQEGNLSHQQEQQSKVEEPAIILRARPRMTGNPSNPSGPSREQVVDANGNTSNTTNANATSNGSSAGSDIVTDGQDLSQQPPEHLNEYRHHPILVQHEEDIYTETTGHNLSLGEEDLKLRSAKYALRHSARYARGNGYPPDLHPQFEPLDPGEYGGGGPGDVACIDFQRQQPPPPPVDDYLRQQYSPQSTSRADWPPGSTVPVAQQLAHVSPWPDSRTWLTGEPANQRYVMPQSHAHKWLQDQGPAVVSSAATSPLGRPGSGSSGKKMCVGDLPMPPSGNFIPDETLAKLTVKELNKRVQNFPREDVVALKQRRRTLKNRGYAMNCRLRRQQHKETLEIQVENLMSQLRREQKEKAFYKSAYEKSLSSNASNQPPPGHEGQLDLSMGSSAAASNDDYKRGSTSGGHVLYHQSQGNLMQHVHGHDIKHLRVSEEVKLSELGLGHVLISPRSVEQDQDQD